jgi:fucose 4-O-acetylase-like acetyltransferase
MINMERTNRLVWIDWMKAIGMLLIIWGHCFPIGLTSFVYSFSVPLFFMVSGYLSKNENSLKLFWKKNLRTLVIPYLLLCFIKDADFWIKNLCNLKELFCSFCGIFLGFHTFEDAPGAKNLWFVYSLFLLKLLFQLIKSDKWRLGITVFSVAAGVVYNRLGIELSWAFTNSFLAMPYFLIGHLFKTSWRESLETVIGRVRQFPLFIAVFMCAVLFVVVYMLSGYNGPAWMYCGNYGNSVFLFYFLGFLGTFGTFVISILLNMVRMKAITIISAGTIVVLQFHRDVYHPLGKFILEQGWVNVGSMGVSTFLASVVVLFVFVPVILIVGKYFPILLGGRRF